MLADRARCSRRCRRCCSCTCKSKRRSCIPPRVGASRVTPGNHLFSNRSRSTSLPGSAFRLSNPRRPPMSTSSPCQSVERHSPRTYLRGGERAVSLARDEARSVGHRHARRRGRAPVVEARGGVRSSASLTGCYRAPATKSRSAKVAQTRRPATKSRSAKVAQTRRQRSTVRGAKGSRNRRPQADPRSATEPRLRLDIAPQAGVPHRTHEQRMRYRRTSPRRCWGPTARRCRHRSTSFPVAEQSCSPTGAIRAGPTPHRVEILGRAPDQALVAVVDPGPGLPRSVLL